MKTNKFWLNLIVALMLPLSFALTACDEEDDDKGSSNSLSETIWSGSDNDGNYYYMAFDKEHFVLIEEDGNSYCEGIYSVSASRIRFSEVSNSGSRNLLHNGSYEYELTGRSGNRDLEIYEVLSNGDDLYLYEEDDSGSGSYDDDYDGSNDDWDYDW